MEHRDAKRLPDHFWNAYHKKDKTTEDTERLPGYLQIPFMGIQSHIEVPDHLKGDPELLLGSPFQGEPRTINESYLCKILSKNNLSL